MSSFTERCTALIRLILQHKMIIAGLAILVIIATLAALAPWVASFPPDKLAISQRLHPINADFWFGTDEFGRDVFSRTIHAGRLSLVVGVAVVCLASAIGVSLGLVAGFFRRLDPFVGRVVDAMMSLPDVLLAISVVAALGPSLAAVIIALGIVYAPRMARIVRASTLVISKLPYVEAARALGVSTPRILVRHVLRNLLSPVLVQGTFIFSHAMLAEAGLSFLGLGVSPEIPTWGTMLASGREYLEQAGWMTFFPGIAIVLAVASLQLVGDGLRDLLDPRLRKAL